MTTTPPATPSPAELQARQEAGRAAYAYITARTGVDKFTDQVAALTPQGAPPEAFAAVAEVITAVRRALVDAMVTPVEGALGLVLGTDGGNFLRSQPPGTFTFPLDGELRGARMHAGQAAHTLLMGGRTTVGAKAVEELREAAHRVRAAMLLSDTEEF